MEIEGGASKLAALPLKKCNDAIDDLFEHTSLIICGFQTFYMKSQSQFDNLALYAMKTAATKKWPKMAKKSLF